MWHLIQFITLSPWKEFMSITASAACEKVCAVSLQLVSILSLLLPLHAESETVKNLPAYSWGIMKGKSSKGKSVLQF